MSHAPHWSAKYPYISGLIKSRALPKLVVSFEGSARASFNFAQASFELSRALPELVVSFEGSAQASFNFDQGIPLGFQMMQVHASNFDKPLI